MQSSLAGFFSLAFLLPPVIYFLARFYGFFFLFSLPLFSPEEVGTKKTTKRTEKKESAESLKAIFFYLPSIGEGGKAGLYKKGILILVLKLVSRAFK